MPRITPDLMPPEAPLAPVFPLGGAARALTLYPGDTGEVRVHWRLHADQVVGQGARFPSADGVPEAVLRLGRLQAEGGAELVHERRLHLSGLSGSGEIAFRIGEDFALLEAELGLMNPEGGWLLLTRSNRLQSARGLGLESLCHPESSERLVRGQKQFGPSDSFAPAFSRSPQSLSREGRVADPDQSSLEQSSSSVDVFSRHSDGSATIGDQTGFTEVRTATAIPVLNYADPVPATTRVVIEAELRIHGWSAPNTEIDLFGQRYRVGPGGRFQLSVKVEDPELIRRALEQHPPSGSVDPR